MLVSTLLVVATLAGPAQTSRPIISCTLSNGDRISGELRAITTKRLRIDHEVLGTLVLKRVDVAVCESADSAAVARLGDLVLAPLPEVPPPQLAALPTWVAATPILPQRWVAITIERLIHPSRVIPLAARALPTYVSHVGWTRSLGSTYMLSRGNTNVSNLGFTGSIARRANRSQVALHVKREFGSQEGRSTENYMSATMRYDLALGPNDSAAAARPSFFTEAVFEHDPFAKIGRRAVENTGVSVPLARDPHNNLALEIGSGVTNEMPTGSASYTRIGGLLRLAARQLFGGATADQQLAIFPDLSGPTGHYRLNEDINLSAPISKAIALKLGIANRYDTRPQANVLKNDTTIQSGIALAF
jgi:putative salt-induced outer membrane protein YdiY